MRFFLKMLTLFVLMTAEVPPVTAQETIMTPYFTIILPEAWSMPHPVAEGDGTVFALFVNKQDGSLVTITVTPGSLSAREVAIQTTTSLKRQQGVESSQPVEQNGLYMTTFVKSGIEGTSWYGSNGKQFAVTTVMGKDGAALLKDLKPVDAALFPMP
ncbi:MAG: hypothetical protein J5861_05920 [Desulfovibrio sp.]|nr:hypothetical protein [Desulfovibrio sp.]